MTIEEFLLYFPDYKVSPEQLAWAKFLEQQGLRFLIDFGFNNAERIASESIDFSLLTVQ